MSGAVVLVEMESASLRETLEAWRGLSASNGVLALLPEAEQGRLPLLQGLCRELAIPLYGAIFPALVADEEFIGQGVWLLRLDSAARAALVSEMDQDPTRAAEAIARVADQLLEQAPAGDSTLFMVFDGMLPNIASTLDQIYLRLADRARYAGVNAGSERFQPMPCLFDADRLIGNGVLCLLLPGARPVAVEHGYLAPEHSMVASSSQGNRITAIDWRSAFEVYSEIIKGDYGVELTPENFYHYGVHYPFGILRANDEVVVRIPVALTEEGAIFCVGEVPENAMLVLLKAPAASDDLCIDCLVRELNAKRDTARPGPLLTFYCAGRRLHMGEGARLELQTLRRRSNASLIAGALTLGEIGGRESDYPVFHNAALVCRYWDGA